MRGAAVCVLICVGVVVSNIGATESRKYKDSVIVKEEAGTKLLVSEDGQNNIEKTIVEKTNEDGSRSTIYKKELRRKLDGKTSLMVVTEEVRKNERCPKGFKVIRSVVSGIIDDKYPEKSALSSSTSETYPDFESWTPMFPDNRPVEETNNRQELVPQPTGEILETRPPQFKPESGRNLQDRSIVNGCPPFAAHDGKTVSAQTVDGMTGPNPTQYGPGSGNNPQNPSIVNRSSISVAHDGKTVSSQIVDGMTGPNPTQYGPGSGNNPQNPSIVNGRSISVAHDGKTVSSQIVDGMTGPNPTQYGPGSGNNPQNPSIVNGRSISVAYNGKKESSQLPSERAGAYHKHIRSKQ